MQQHKQQSKEHLMESVAPVCIESQGGEKSSMCLSKESQKVRPNVLSRKSAEHSNPKRYSILTLLEIRADLLPGQLLEAFKEEAEAVLTATNPSPSASAEKEKQATNNSDTNEADNTYNELGEGYEEAEDIVKDSDTTTTTADEFSKSETPASSSSISIPIPTPNCTHKEGEGNTTANEKQSQSDDRALLDDTEGEPTQALTNRRRRRRKERKVMRVAVKLIVTVRRARCAWVLSEQILNAITNNLCVVALGEKAGKKATPKVIRAAQHFSTLPESTSISFDSSLISSDSEDGEKRSILKKDKTEGKGTQFKYETSLMTAVNDWFPVWMFTPRFLHISAHRASQSYQIAAHEIFNCLNNPEGQGSIRGFEDLNRKDGEKVLAKELEDTCSQLSQDLDKSRTDALLSESKQTYELEYSNQVTMENDFSQRLSSSRIFKTTPAHMMGSVSSLHFTGLEVDTSGTSHILHPVEANWTTPVSDLSKSVNQTFDSPPAAEDWLMSVRANENKDIRVSSGDTGFLVSPSLYLGSTAPLSTKQSVSGLNGSSVLPSVSTLWQLGLPDEQFGISPMSSHDMMPQVLASGLAGAESADLSRCSVECAALGSVMCSRAQIKLNQLEEAVKRLQSECEVLRRERNLLSLQCKEMQQKTKFQAFNVSEDSDQASRASCIDKPSDMLFRFDNHTPLNALNAELKDKQKSKHCTKLCVSLPGSPLQNGMCGSSSSPLSLSLGPTASGDDLELGFARALRKYSKTMTNASSNSRKKLSLPESQAKGKKNAKHEQKDHDLVAEDELSWCISNLNESDSNRPPFGSLQGEFGENDQEEEVAEVNMGMMTGKRDVGESSLFDFNLWGEGSHSPEAQSLIKADQSKRLRKFGLAARAPPSINATTVLNDLNGLGFDEACQHLDFLQAMHNGAVTERAKKSRDTKSRRAKFKTLDPSELKNVASYREDISSTTSNDIHHSMDGAGDSGEFELTMGHCQGQIEISSGDSMNLEQIGNLVSSTNNTTSGLVATAASALFTIPMDWFSDHQGGSSSPDQRSNNITNGLWNIW